LRMLFFRFSLASTFVFAMALTSVALRRAPRSGVCS
jgi:hypothetical protein